MHVYGTYRWVFPELWVGLDQVDLVLQVNHGQAHHQSNEVKQRSHGTVLKGEGTDYKPAGQMREIIPGTDMGLLSMDLSLTHEICK